jgi:hypothetical protein
MDRAYNPAKTVFFAFPWEAIHNADPANGAAVLDEIVSWLAP